MEHWSNWDDIFQYSLTLHSFERTSFLIVFSAIWWVLWKHKNDMCFNYYALKSARSIILQIKTTVAYWICNVKKKAKETLTRWMPLIENAIPLDCIPEVVMYQPPLSVDASDEWKDKIHVIFLSLALFLTLYSMALY